MNPEPSSLDRRLPGPAASYPRVAARLARQVELALANIDMSLPQYRILMLLDEGPAVASGLAEHLAVSRPTVTAVVDGLVSRGLVVRRHDEEGDRRRVGLSMTTAGQRLLGLADRSVQARLLEVASHLDDPGGADAVLAGLDAWMPALIAHRAAHQKRKS